MFSFSSPTDTITNPKFPEHEHLKCPRCDSTNTKFCYYNNYNLSQPRYFCKNCRRYWTKGGTLRNVPIGGGSRKITKRSSNSSKNASPVTLTPPPTKPVPEVIEPSVGCLGTFGSLLMEGSDFDVVRESSDGDFGSSLLRLNDERNESGGGEGEESIFTTGSRFFSPGSCELPEQGSTGHL